MKTKMELMVVGVLILGSISTAGAGTDEGKCLASRVKAQAKLEQCVGKWIAKIYAGGLLDTAAQESLAKCRIKHAKTWKKVQGLGTTCAQESRFSDNGDGTVTDNLTGLVWEKKSDNGDDHDKDTGRKWSTGAPYAGNAGLFTNFLTAGLNTPGFAGTNDWRLPSFSELQTILLPEPYPCATNPCVDPAFNSSCAGGCSGTTCSCSSLSSHFSATTFQGDVSTAWGISFIDGSAGNLDKAIFLSVRAVRGGQ